MLPVLPADARTVNQGFAMMKNLQMKENRPIPLGAERDRWHRTWARTHDAARDGLEAMD